MYCFFVIVSFILFAMPITGSGWAEGSNVLLEPGRVCEKKLKLRGKLAEICNNETTIMSEIKLGLNMSFYECNTQFKNRRWNCTTARKSIRKILVKDTRETAFVNAITAAGITYQVTKACSRGSLVECSCDKTNQRRNRKFINNNNNQINNNHNNNNNVMRRKKKKQKKLNNSDSNLSNSNNNINFNNTISDLNIKNNKNDIGFKKKKKKKKLNYNFAIPEGDWKWGGCDDDVNFGFKKSRDFLDARYRKRSDIKTLLKLHNNNAGRLAVKNLVRLECKCHGLSTSCTMKTCWLKLPKFNEIGKALKERFDGAVKVIAENNGKNFMPEDPTIKFPENVDLVYSDDSPDFCRQNHKTGSIGTTGRECNATSQGVDGCDLLCCNRGYDQKIVREKVNCNCQFTWCCTVTCQTCIEKREVNTCR